MEISEWKIRLDAQRQGKDRFFGQHWQSPIPSEERASFERLTYYPPDPDYRFELKLHEHGHKQIMKIEDTVGNIRSLIRWGEFRFKITGTECVLQAYKSDSREERLFVPLRDATSGKETYNAGRYLDLDPENHLTPEGKWIVDFNEVYNPFCAYSQAYACPFVPPENWLKVPVHAGEKDYVHKKQRRLTND
ncbi:MAG: hypothetical protein AMJ89_04815 [candidate division Zixibacteria bacterium SM23_73]|nr:MAG: hypothetical protein AMJ89_04815 [candidate division Zixibacteria bacterium SM23_73]